MPRPKKQHFVPQLHLKHFVGADPPEMVWTYDITLGRISPSLPRETAAETNFYSTEISDGKYDDRLEKWLAGVETKASAPYTSLLRGEIPEGQQRADFAVFASSLFARSPSMRRFYAETLAARHHAITKALTATPNAFEGALRKFEAAKGTIDPDVRARLYDFARDSSKYELDVHREATLPALEVSDDLVELFFEMDWAVLVSDVQHLITCDSPVCRAVPGVAVDPVRGDGGFLNKKTEVTLPLSPQHCLLMTWGGPKGFFRVDKKVARQLNIHRAFSAERYLYAHRTDGGIQRMAKKYRRRGHLVRVEGMISNEELPPINVVRR